MKRAAAASQRISGARVGRALRLLRLARRRLMALERRQAAALRSRGGGIGRVRRRR